MARFRPGISGAGSRRAAVRGGETGGGGASSLRARGVCAAAATSPRVPAASGVRRLQAASSGAIWRQPLLRSVRTRCRVSGRRCCCPGRHARRLASSGRTMARWRGHRFNHHRRFNRHRAVDMSSNPPMAGGRPSPAASQRFGTGQAAAATGGAFRLGADGHIFAAVARPTPDRLAPAPRKGMDPGVKRGHGAPIIGSPCCPGIDGGAAGMIPTRGSALVRPRGGGGGMVAETLAPVPADR
jgi:hypothetical protein